MRIEKSLGLNGEITVPGDKSVSHRALLLGAAADGRTVIHGVPESADCLATAACLAALGVNVRREGRDITVEGAGLRGFRKPSRALNAGNSATTMRLLAGLLAGQDFDVTITGDKSLSRRPMRRVAAPLAAMGCEIRTDAGGHAPLFLHGGSLKGISWRTPVASAQVKSAILLAGLYADRATTVTEPAASRDHTERMLSAFGAEIRRNGTSVTVLPADRLEACELTVPGDFSSAACFLAAGLLVPGSDILIRNTGINPTRTGFLAAAERMGAEILVENLSLRGGEPAADLRVRSASLHGTVIEGAEIPSLIDELPLLALMGACAEGETVIRDAAELRVKESDRIAVISEGLRRLGADITPTADGMVIRGGKPLKGAVVDSRGDHRAAMTFAVAGLVAGIRETRLLNSGCVNVSYPAFFDDLHRLEKGMEGQG